MFLVIIGIVVIAVGGLIYAVAWTETVNSNWWDDPYSTDPDPFNGFLDLMMVSYVVMSIGTVLLFVGMILLVLNE